MVPNFLKHVEGRLANSKFLVGDDLTIADFWIGGFYTNYAANPIVYAPERWSALMDKHPNFKAYGERFKEANAKWLSSRPPAPC